MLAWIIGGAAVALVAISVGIWLGHRARNRRRQAWQRFARKRSYDFDAELDAIRGEVDGVPFEIRAYSQVDEDGETVSYTEVTFERNVELFDLGQERVALELDDDRSGWRRPGRARRTRVLQREVDLIERQVAGKDAAGD